MKVQCVYAGKCEHDHCWHHEPHEEIKIDCADCGGVRPCSDPRRRLCDWQTRKIAVCCVPVGKKRTSKKAKKEEHPMVGTVKKLASMDVINACPGTATCSVESCAHYGPHQPHASCRQRCGFQRDKGICQTIKERKSVKERLMPMMKAKVKVLHSNPNHPAYGKSALESIMEQITRRAPASSLVRCTRADDKGCIKASCKHYGRHTKHSSCKLNKCWDVNKPVLCVTKDQMDRASSAADKIVDDVVKGIMRVVDEHRATGKSSQELQQHNVDSKVAVQIKLQTLHRLPGE